MNENHSSNTSSKPGVNNSHTPRGGLFGAIHEFHRRHERLKKFVHEGMRYPLPPAGRAFMGFVYFCIPVIGGCAIMAWTAEKSKQSIGEHGERLPIPAGQNMGNRRVLDNGEVQKVGAGGWGGGVHLVVSDEETQKKTQRQIRKFLRMQKKKMQEQGEDANLGDSS
jgi:hypothetical protein